MILINPIKSIEAKTNNETKAYQKLVNNSGLI